jgi:acylphosphatase
MSTRRRVHIFVSGRVQGVFFRHYTLQKALELGLKGWVRNLEDGRVEVVCEGEEDKVKSMAAWCKKGPPGAFVKDTESYWEEYAGDFDTFRILH